MGKVVNKILNLTLVIWFMKGQRGFSMKTNTRLSHERNVYNILRGGDVYNFELFQRSLDFVVTSDSVR